MSAGPTTSRSDLVVLAATVDRGVLLDAVAGLRRSGKAPVVVVCDESTQEDRAAVLDAGADDVLTQPVDPIELWARINGILRRAPRGTGRFECATLPIGRHLVNLADRSIRLADGGGRVRISPTQWRLLAILMGQPGRTFSTEDLLMNVWGHGHRGRPDYVRQYVGQLRRRLEDNPPEPRHLLTDPEGGYRYQA
jgi:two-component system KDP operon response regulator KdpE